MPAKNADGSSGENLNNVLNKALIELSHICLAEPYKIRILLQMAKDQANFAQKAKPSEDWLRRSYVYFSSVPKGLWVEVSVEYAAITGDRWDGDLIRKADRKNDLHGIQVLTSFLGSLTWQDRIPRDAFYKPLLKAVLLDQFKKVGHGACISKDGVITYTKPAGGICKFDSVDK